MHKENSSISSFRKYVFSVLFPVILLVGLLVTVFSFFFEKYIILDNENCGAYKVNRILTVDDKYEIPILGSSRAESSFVPEILGAHYFNYGINATQDDVMLFFINEICKKKDKSSHIIIANFDMDGINRRQGDIVNYLYNSDNDGVKKLIGNQFLYSLPFLKYFGKFEDYFRDFLNDRLQLTKYSKGGASIEKKTLSKSEIEEMIEYRRTHEDVSLNEEDLEKEFFYAINKNKDMFFVFVVAPYHYSYFSNYKNPEIVEEIVGKLAVLPNVKVFDFSHVIYPDTLFTNTTHLNYAGAIRFSREFKDSLATLKITKFN